MWLQLWPVATTPPARSDPMQMLGERQTKRASPEPPFPSPRRGIAPRESRPSLPSRKGTLAPFGPALTKAGTPCPLRKAVVVMPRGEEVAAQGELVCGYWYMPEQRDRDGFSAYSPPVDGHEFEGMRVVRVVALYNLPPRAISEAVTWVIWVSRFPLISRPRCPCPNQTK